MEFSRTGPATTVSNDRRKHPSCPFDMSLNSSTLMIAQPTGSQVRDSPRQPSYSYVLAYLVGSASPTSSSSTILALFWVGGIPTAKYEFYKKNFKKKLGAFTGFVFSIPHNADQLVGIMGRGRRDRPCEPCYKLISCCLGENPTAEAHRQNEGLNGVTSHTTTTKGLKGIH